MEKDGNARKQDKTQKAITLPETYNTNQHLREANVLGGIISMRNDTGAAIKQRLTKANQLWNKTKTYLQIKRYILKKHESYYGMPYKIDTNICTTNARK